MWLKMTRICLKIFNKIKFCSFVSFQITSSGLMYFDPTPIRKKSERANRKVQIDYQVQEMATEKWTNCTRCQTFLTLVDMSSNFLRLNKRL